MSPREVFVISDLHLGGDAHDASVPGGRGFAMCKQGRRLGRFIQALARSAAPIELVIAGDFVDFLAETGHGGWRAFHDDAEDAARILRTIATEREPEVFAGLRALIEGGHRLVVLVGNHDVELVLPPVRRALFSLLGADEHGGLELIQGEEPYVVADALIEHGNRLDAYNRVDWEAVQRWGAMEARRTPRHERDPVEAPAGSRLVEQVMNPIKQEWPFVDLLKPETAAAVPVLLALDPSALSRTAEVLWLLGGARIEALGGRRDLSAGRGPAQPVEDAIRLALGEDADEYLALLRQETEVGTVRFTRQPLSAGSRGPGGQDPTDRSWKRDRLLYRTLKKILKGDRTLDLSAGDGEYEKAARILSGRGFKTIVMGHTHQARCLDLGNGARYLNTGTWADLIGFPAEILDEPEVDALARLSAFLDDMHAGRLDAWVLQRPTYARLRVEDGTAQPMLCQYELVSDDPFDPGNELPGASPVDA